MLLRSTQTRWRIEPMTREKHSAGFTLVELLIVVAIIAILAAISIPQFSAYIQKSVRARMVSDAKNAYIMQENYQAENQTYIEVGATTGAAAVALGIDTLYVSESNTLTIAPGGTGITDSFIITVANPKGGAGKNPLTWQNAGQCTWADGTNC